MRAQNATLDILHEDGVEARREVVLSRGKYSYWVEREYQVQCYDGGGYIFEMALRNQMVYDHRDAS